MNSEMEGVGRATDWAGQILIGWQGGEMGSGIGSGRRGDHYFFKAYVSEEPLAEWLKSGLTDLSR